MPRPIAAILSLILVAGSARPMAAGEPAAAPSFVDVPYGTDSERQRFDLWKAETGRPAPLVLLIHGGGWRRGDKSDYRADAIQPFLDAGISVATLNYRFIDQCMEQDVEPPVKGCLLDAARALQTLRARAAEWNIDPARIGATGVSAGACTSLWLALHDDLANPAGADPVARQSTRLACAAGSGAQTSLDPRELRAWIPNAEYGGHAFGFTAPGRDRPGEFALLVASRERLLPWIREYSPIELVTPDDPPLFLDYPKQGTPPVPGTPQPDPTHTAIYGIKLAERLRDRGVEAVVTWPGHADPRYGSATAFLIAKLTGRASAAAGGSEPWAAVLDRMASEATHAPDRERLVAAARRVAAKPVIRRAHRLEEVGRDRTWLDGRANALEDEIREAFALAMSDHGACGILAEELPLLAAACRLTGDDALEARLVAQLEETAGWSPLQRPGWTLYHPGARLAEGGDGNWLATGTGVRAIADALEIAPAGTIDEALRRRLRALLEKEVAGVVDDWHTARPWFVRDRNPVTNQWVLPTEGLIRACLVLGAEAHRDAYELGVRNMLESLDAHGSAGEFEEGFGYASFTVASMLHAARAMAAHGDRRALDHAFLRNFPTWLAHHLQPGDMAINCFDAGPARDAGRTARPLFSLLAACTGSPVARWALTRQLDGPADDLAGLVARAAPPVGDDVEPPPFAAYERATRVNWRSGWNPDATGVWVRGGHPTDQHDHCDRGHVNFILHGRPVLIEAGTPSYSHPLMGSHFASGYGHNVLQLGLEQPRPVQAGETLAQPGWQQPGVVAPVAVHRLDSTGGDVSLRIADGYAGLAEWRRDVAWDDRSLRVADAVRLAEGRADVILFRWHLGTNVEPEIIPTADGFDVVWDGARMTIGSERPIEVSAIRAPDNAVNVATDDARPETFHTCVVVASTRPLERLEVEMRVTGR